MKMAKRFEISAEEAVEIRKKMKSIKNKNACRRLEALALLGEGRKPKEVADIKGYNEKTVRILRSEYCKNGLEPFLTDGRKGGNHIVMSKEESQKFLSEFEEKAKAGQIITIEEIAKALDEATGKQRESLSTAYYFLHRHGWRKVMPRSQHPKKASDEAISASKKLTLKSEK